MVELDHDVEHCPRIRKHNSRIHSQLAKGHKIILLSGSKALGPVYTSGEGGPDVHAEGNVEVQEITILRLICKGATFSAVSHLRLPLPELLTPDGLLPEPFWQIAGHLLRHPSPQMSIRRTSSSKNLVFQRLA